MLTEQYVFVDRRMSMSRPEVRNMITTARTRGISSPGEIPYSPYAQAIARSYSAAPAFITKPGGKEASASSETWVPPPSTETSALLSKEVIFPEKRKLTARGLMILLYFWTCGGPFGVETAVASGGALLTWCSMVVASFLWSLPQAIMAAELSLMMDVNGGNIIWVKRAFGDFFAFINAQCYMVLNLSTLSLLVSLFVSYIPNSETLEPYANWGIRVGFVIVVVATNLFGLEMLSRLSTVLLILIFMPFVAQMYAIAYYKPPVHFDKLAWVPDFDSINWGTFISTVVWSFGGFDSVGSVAGDVAGGKRTFLLGVMGSFPLALINYFWPIMLDFILDPNIENWHEGYFTQITFKVFPSPWIGIWLTIASAISNFAQCSSGLAPVAWTIWAMARGEETNVEYLPPFLGIEWQRSEDGPILPVAAIFFVGISILAISAIPYELILQTYLLFRIVNLLFEYGSLIWLKIKEPDTPRPWEIPFGLPGAILVVTPTVCIAGLSLAVAAPEARLIGGGCLGVIFVIACIKELVRYIIRKRQERYDTYEAE
jgi:amino acid transporter